MKRKFLHAVAIMITLSLIVINLSCDQTNELYEVDYTNIEVINQSDRDSVKVFLTIQSPNSVVGMFGIKDTTGSKSQGYFYAKKGVPYYLNTTNTLFGFNISFDAPPMSCTGAIANGFKNGINIFEGSINCEFEVFDISCVDGANCVLQAIVSDSTNWTTGTGSDQKIFWSTKNSIELGSNCNVRGVFPYRCTDCIQINPKNVPANCFNLPDTCSSDRTCQVSRTDHNGGMITLKYLGEK